MLCIEGEVDEGLMGGFIFGSPWGSRRGWRNQAVGFLGFFPRAASRLWSREEVGIFRFRNFPGGAPDLLGMFCVMGAPLKCSPSSG